MMEELRKEEDELAKKIVSLTISDDEVDEEEDDDDGVIVITNEFEPSKSGISLSEYISRSSTRSNSPVSVFTRME
jgi:hypothetical protein